MNAMQKVLEYARKHNDGTLGLTDQEYVGKMAQEGTVINRTPFSRTVAKAKRVGYELIITETVIEETNVVTHKGMTRGEDKETTTEILRVDVRN